jgi:DNA-binding transcriptional ArsR family regulator
MEQGEVSVSELVGLAGLSQSGVSQHLALLREAGVVAVRASAQTRYYSLRDPTVRVVITALCTLCESNGQAPEPTTRSGESSAP